MEGVGQHLDRRVNVGRGGRQRGEGDDPNPYPTLAFNSEFESGGLQGRDHGRGAHSESCGREAGGAGGGNVEGTDGLADLLL